MLRILVVLQQPKPKTQLDLIFSNESYRFVVERYQAIKKFTMSVTLTKLELFPS